MRDKRGARAVWLEFCASEIGLLHKQFYLSHPDERPFTSEFACVSARIAFGVSEINHARFITENEKGENLPTSLVRDGPATREKPANACRRAKSASWGIERSSRLLKAEKSGLVGMRMSMKRLVDWTLNTRSSAADECSQPPTKRGLVHAPVNKACPSFSIAFSTARGPIIRHTNLR